MVSTRQSRMLICPNALYGGGKFDIQFYIKNKTRTKSRSCSVSPKKKKKKFIKTLVYRVGGRLEVQKRFAHQHTPAPFGVSVSHFGQPSLDGRFVVFVVQQQPGSVVPLDVLFVDRHTNDTRCSLKCIKMLKTRGVDTARAFVSHRVGNKRKLPATL